MKNFAYSPKAGDPNKARIFTSLADAARLAHRLTSYDVDGYRYKAHSPWFRSDKVVICVINPDDVVTGYLSS